MPQTIAANAPSAAQENAQASGSKSQPMSAADYVAYRDKARRKRAKESSKLEDGFVSEDSQHSHYVWRLGSKKARYYATAGNQTIYLQPGVHMDLPQPVTHLSKAAQAFREQREAEQAQVRAAAEAKAKETPEERAERHRVRREAYEEAVAQHDARHEARRAAREERHNERAAQWAAEQSRNSFSFFDFWWPGDDSSNLFWP